MLIQLIERPEIALRQAAEWLLAESRDESRPETEREIAGEALVRLFSYCDAMQP